MSRSLRFPVPACLAALLLVGALPALARPIPYDDLRALLQADFPEEVVLAIVQAEGPPALASNQWLELRTLGASDRLLRALVPGEVSVDAGAAAPPAEPPRSATPATDERSDEVPTTRAFYDRDAEGTRVLVLTNLDDDGQRLGGQVASPAPRNLVASGRPPAPAPAAPETPEAPEARATAAGDDAVAVASGSAAAANATVILPEYLPPAAGTVSAFVPVSRYYGFFYPYPDSYLYPPGSYTHLKLYHEGGRRGFTHYQLPAGQVFYGPPFPGAGSHRPERP